MKKNYFFIFFNDFYMGFSQTTLATYSFDDGASVNAWSTVADAASKPSEVSLGWNATGNGTGALEISGVNPDGVGGRAYIFEFEDTGFDFMGSASINVSFDAKFVGVYASAAFHLQNQVPGAGTVNNFDNQGAINETTWSNISKDISGLDYSGANPMRFVIHFQIAAGAVIGGGGTVLIDNIVITGTQPTCTDGVKNGDETGIDCGGASCVACAPTAPTDAPTMPTITAENAISLFSDAYSDLAATWNPNWGQTTVVTDETIASNLLKKYSSFTFSGVEPTGGTINATTMTYINLDYWTSDATDLKIKLVDYLGDGTWGGDNIEVEITKPVSTNSWGTVSIALTEFTAANGAFELDDIGQLVLSAVGASNAVYLDNFYFSIGSALGVEDNELTSFKAYPNPTQNSWRVKTKSESISSIRVFDILGKNVISLSPNASEVSIDGSSLKTGLYFAQIKTANNISSIKLVKQE